jgi:phenylacetate-CoA ligase
MSNNNLDHSSTNDSLFAAKRLEKFRALVKHANTKSPYYRQLIADRGIDPQTCVPKDFPVLTKSLLMANFDAIVTNPKITKQIIADFLTRSTDPKERLFNRYTVLHTSGTSGEVGYFLTDWRDALRTSGSLSGYRKGRQPDGHRSPYRDFRRPRMAFYGATGGHYAGVTMMARMQRGIARLLVNAESFEINSPLGSVVTKLNAFQPDILFGYTTGLKILAEQQRAGSLHIRPRRLLASGETVTKDDIEYLSAAFGDVPVHSLYACTEHMMMGHSNPDNETMTLNDTNLIFEFFEDHSLVTNLFNYTMPLIRYRMSDILKPISAPGEHPIIVENLVGRSEQMPSFKAADGSSDFISPHTINEVFVKGVARFQMQVTSDTSFRFPVCVESGLTPEQRSAVVAGVTKRLTEILEQKGLGNVRFEVPIVEDIPVNPITRKFQLIVNARPASISPV